MIPAKIYPLTIPAGGSFPLQCYGSFFKVLGAAGTFEVAGDSFGQLGALLAGQGLRLESGVFQRLTFRDTSGGANSLRVLVAGDGFVDDRITGEVSVIDDNRSLSLANMAFAGFADVGASAGNFSHIQLWNPAAGYNLEVDRVKVSCVPAGAGTIFLMRDTAPRATFIRSTWSMLFGGAGGVGTVRSEYAAAAVAGLVDVMDMQSFSGGSEATLLAEFKRPIIVPPGSGLTAYVNIANLQLRGHMWHVQRVIA